jgi:hypothetical protein
MGVAAVVKLTPDLHIGADPRDGNEGLTQPP